MNYVATIGPNPNKTKSMDVNITYPNPIGVPPEGISYSIVLTGSIVLDPSYSLSKFTDCYTVNFANITNTGFTARVFRVDLLDNDNSGWDMNLSLNYVVSTTMVQ